MSNEAIVTIPPEVVRMRASSTVFVKASSLVNLDFAGIAAPTACKRKGQSVVSRSSCRVNRTRWGLELHPGTDGVLHSGAVAVEAVKTKKEVCRWRY